MPLSAQIKTLIKTTGIGR